MERFQTSIAGLALEVLQNSANKPESGVATRASKQVVVVAAGVQCSKMHRGSGNEIEAGTGRASPLFEVQNHGGSGIEETGATETLHRLRCVDFHMLSKLMCKKLTPARTFRGGSGGDN